MKKLHFKITCPDCFLQYSVKDIFAESALNPLGVRLIKENDEDYYYFLHSICGCLKQAKVSTRAFDEFIKNTKSRKLKFSKKECNLYCIKADTDSGCTQECLFAVYRKFFLQLLFLKDHIGNRDFIEYLDSFDADRLITFETEAVA